MDSADPLVVLCVDDDAERAADADSWDAVAGDDTAAALTVDDDLGDVVADRDRLCQLLENLFRNAIEHVGPEVGVRVVSTDDGFAVEDDGPGIPEDARADLFDRGYTTEDDGTGFGLYIVETIANAHGWTVTVTDAAGGGPGSDATGTSSRERRECDGGARFEFAGVERGARTPQ